MRRDERWWWMVGLLGWVAVSAGVLAAILLASWYRQSADYPGAQLVADHTTYGYGSHFTIRRDASYRSGDRFPDVYNWYSSTFRLGTEVRAQGGCILLARSFKDLNVIRRDMAVTLCDTANGRMIFVMRSLSVRWR